MGKKKIPNSLWTYRKKTGLSQKRVAFFLGHKTSSQLSNYERGKKTPGLENALKLEIIYKVPVAFLYKDLYQKLQAEVGFKREKLKKMLEYLRKTGKGFRIEASINTMSFVVSSSNPFHVFLPGN